MSGSITLVLGGTRSGKSEIAEALALETGPRVAYIATGQVTDPGMAERIALHRARRGPAWVTVEAAGTNLAVVLDDVQGPALVDSLGTWVAAHPDLDPDVVNLQAALRVRRDRGDDTVLVSEEVGLGVHAPTEVGRRFADVLGGLNRTVADGADEVLLVVAGRVMPLPARRAGGTTS